jgi:Leucine-rich repeat (LRR) protein
MCGLSVHAPAELTGTIPLSIRQLTNLQHVFLSFNKLRGSLNGRFCTRRSDPLEVLILRANFFTGTANMTGCQQLLLLDVTDNQLTGPVPVGMTNSKLISLRGSNNLFDGRIPDALWKLPMLTTVDMSNNE